MCLLRPSKILSISTVCKGSTAAFPSTAHHPSGVALNQGSVEFRYGKWALQNGCKCSSSCCVATDRISKSQLAYRVSMISDLTVNFLSLSHLLEGIFLLCVSYYSGETPFQPNLSEIAKNQVFKCTNGTDKILGF